MPPAVQRTDALEALDDQRRHGDQPAQQDTVALAVADVLHPVAVLGVVEALVFNLPTALHHLVPREAAGLARGEAG